VEAQEFLETGPRSIPNSQEHRLPHLRNMLAGDLLTLALYVTVNLPQQKKDLRDALKSKAQGVSSSVQEVTAGAAMSEDYSTVVDHCVQVLKGDEAIEYLVITKADGFSSSSTETGGEPRRWAGSGARCRVK